MCADDCAVEELRLKEGFLARPYFRDAIGAADPTTPVTPPEVLKIIESHGDQV